MGFLLESPSARYTVSIMRLGFLLPLFLFFILALVVGVYAGAGVLVEQTKNTTKEVFVKRTGEPVPELSAEAYFVGYVASDGQLKELVGTNADVILPVASITKLLAVPLIEEQLGSESTIRISEYAASISNSNHPTFTAGQSFLSRDLIAVSLIESNNDAVTALAEAMNEETLLSRMRARAEEIGMEGSVWTNATGLDPKDTTTEANSASARGLAKLGAWMLKERPKLLALTREPAIVLTDAYGAEVRMASTTNALIGATDFPFTLLGGKTGETPRSGGNLLTLWRAKNNTIVVVVVMNANDRFVETRALVEYLARAYTVRND